MRGRLNFWLRVNTFGIKKRRINSVLLPQKLQDTGLSVQNSGDLSFHPQKLTADRTRWISLVRHAGRDGGAAWLVAELTARSRWYVSSVDRWTKTLANPRLSISLRVSLIVLRDACLTRMSTSVLAGVRMTLCSRSKSFENTIQNRSHSTESFLWKCDYKKN